MIYTVYKTINTINHKEYIGFHKVAFTEDILYEESENGSIFRDGYLGSGKHMRRALEKYGPIKMKQKLLLVTNDKFEAETFEKELVDCDWISRDDTYNISLGGNVCILFGEDNGFFGRKHSQETIEQIQKTRNNTLKTNPFSWCEIVDTITDVIYYSYDDVYQTFNIVNTDKKEKLFKLYALVNNGRLKYKSSYLQDIAIRKYQERLEWKNKKNVRASEKARICSERFSGVPKSEESNQKRGASVSEWIQNNPEKHKERMAKINKNPTKIKKMADKQRGKIWITHIKTGKNTRHDPSLPIPNEWKRGFNKTK